MIKSLFVLAAATALMMLIGCLPAGTGNNGSDSDSTYTTAVATTQQEMVMESFDVVALDGAANIAYEPGDEHRARIEAPVDVLQWINVWVEDGELHVGNRPGADEVSFDNVTVHVTSPVLTGVNLNGAGNFTAPAPLKADQMHIALVGAGNVTLEGLSCRKLQVQLSGAGNVTVNGLMTNLAETELNGAGNVTLRGKADRHVERMSGTGHIDTSELKSEQ